MKLDHIIPGSVIQFMPPNIMAVDVPLLVIACRKEVHSYSTKLKVLALYMPVSGETLLREIVIDERTVHDYYTWISAP